MWRRGNAGAKPTSETRDSKQAVGGAVGKRTLVETSEANVRAPGAASPGTGLPRLQLKGVPPAPGAVPASGGAPLPPAQRATFERSLGIDLFSVRVHTGAASEAAAASVGARAFATGQDIHFAAGQYQPDDPTGVHLLAHEVAHTVQQRGGNTTSQAKLDVSQPGDASEIEADRFADHIVHGGPRPALSAAPAAIHRQPATQIRARGDLRDPRQFPTYEEFLSAFQELGTFTAHDTPGPTHTNHQVLGDHAADDASPSTADHGVPRRGSHPAETYIEHPTASWVAAHLPPELRMAVYSLPADCADVAILLRHVWLQARGRTERYGRWVIGAGAGRTERQRASNLTRLIRDDVYSGSVSAMISTPYPSRSFRVLDPLLHPGDVLVWAHHDPDTGRRSGGHTQTIQTIDRDGAGKITWITLLQGNQPIHKDQVPEIQADQSSHHHAQTPAKTLRALPGRRIERGDLPGDHLQDIGGVWTWPDKEATSLVAAGPPSGVKRPPTRRIAGEKRPRISDWGPSLRTAAADSIEGVFEAFLFEVRAGLEGASPQAAEIVRDAPDMAAIAGQRLARLRRLTTARRRELIDMLGAQARSVGTHLNPNATPGAAAVFALIDTRLQVAAGLTGP